MTGVEGALASLTLIVGVVAFTGIATATVLRYRGLRWTWAMCGLPPGMVLWELDWPASLAELTACIMACVIGARWHHDDLSHGADLAEAAQARLGLARVLRRAWRSRQNRRGGWIQGGWLRVGTDEQGLEVTMPVGYRSGCHTLVVGATGSGKTVTQAWIAGRLIEHGHGAVVIDPKGDPMLRDELKRAAERRDAQFIEWTPTGPVAYNPYALGTDTEIADKALSGETFTEPHYLRQAQRYLGHAVRVMHNTNTVVTPLSLMAHLDPRQLEVSARQLPEEQAKAVHAYLDSFSDRQKKDLGGVRDRLSILAESDTRQWLDPTTAAETLDLHAAVVERAVIYFRLDADQRPLLAAMLAAAIVSDLITLVARLQDQPVPTVVAIDEFSAIAAEHVSRLFGRARSAGISLILGTQELADLKTVGEGALREQVLGNLATLIAHRQNVPESAELISAIAGTKPVWISTHQTQQGTFAPGPSGRGSRRRGYEYEIHPSLIKRLPTGHAAVITPGTGQRPRIARIHHPNEAR